jgi:hypothetical protein
LRTKQAVGNARTVKMIEHLPGGSLSVWKRANRCHFVRGHMRIDTSSEPVQTTSATRMPAGGTKGRKFIGFSCLPG